MGGFWKVGKPRANKNGVPSSIGLSLSIRTPSQSSLDMSRVFRGKGKEENPHKQKALPSRGLGYAWYDSVQAPNECPMPYRAGLVSPILVRGFGFGKGDHGARPGPRSE